MSTAKSREALVEEIRRLQGSGTSPETAASPSPPAAEAPTATPPAESAPPQKDDERTTLRELLSELTIRLDRTQEQMLSRLGDLSPPPPAAAPSGTPAERALLEEILARLGSADRGASPDVDARLDRIETRLDRILELLSQSGDRGASSMAPLFARFTALEKRWEEAFAPHADGSGPQAPAAPRIDLAPVIAALTTLIDRLVAIQERTPGSRAKRTARH